MRTTMQIIEEDGYALDYTYLSEIMRIADTARIEALKEALEQIEHENCWGCGFLQPAENSEDTIHDLIEQIKKGNY